jgi:hypothetical protein
MKRYSRGQFMRRSAVAVGGVASLGAVRPGAAFARSAGDPRPIPGGFSDTFSLVPKDPFIHVLPPQLGFEMSTITDLNGVVGGAEIQGTAHGSDGTSYDFDTDMRFMQGTYVGLDGRVRKGSFGFV